MIYHYDLHIHSVLSPCADALMTPNNILNMATLKGLNIIAVTDHNCLRQLPTIADIAQSYALLLIPGVEITTLEDVHVLCYFKTIDVAMKFESQIEIHRQTHENAFGEARLTDLEDYVISTLQDVSSQPLTLSYRSLIKVLEPYEHLLVLAHLDRPGMKGFDYLPLSEPDAIELIKPDQAFIEDHRLSRYKILYNSDAHDLMAISEKNVLNTLDLPALNIEAFFRYFQHG